MKIEGREIELSNQDKMLFPDEGITKGDVVDYYRRIAGYMLPLIADRPLVLRRFPDGIEVDGFYQKEASDYLPDWIRTVQVPLKKGGQQVLVVADSAATLVYLANQAMITPHAWLSPADNLECSDKIVIDLDPSTDDFEMVKHGALRLREILEKNGYRPVAMTTGSKGIHVITVLDEPRHFDATRAIAEDVSKELAEAEPDKFTTEHYKRKRGQRVFLDVARNAYGQTAVAPYALRARPGAPVATPLTWEELERLDSPRRYNINNIFQRLSRKEDPWRIQDG